MQGFIISLAYRTHQIYFSISVLLILSLQLGVIFFDITTAKLAIKAFVAGNGR